MNDSQRSIPSLVHQYLDAQRTADTARLDEFISSDFKDHSFPDFSGGPDGVRRAIEWLHHTFDQIEHTIEDCVCNPDTAAVRVITTARHVGTFAGKAPTLKRVTWSSCDFLRVRDGMITDVWSVQDTISLLQGIGALGSR